LLDAFDCKYIDEETLQNFRNKVDEVERLLNGYVNYLEKQISTK